MTEVENNDIVENNVEPTTETSTPPEDTKQEGEQAEKQAEPTEIDVLKKSYEKRISRQTAANAGANKKIAELQQQIAGLQPKQEAVNKGEINEDDFDTYEDYIEAKIKDSADRKFKEQLEKHNQEKEQRILNEQIALEQKEFDRQEAIFRVDVPDYDEVTQVFNEVIATTDADNKTFIAVTQVLKGSDILPEICYHLGSNPDLMTDMLQMTPDKAMREAVRLEYQLNNTKKTNNKKPLAKPPTPVSGGGKGTKSLNSMSGREIMKQFNM